MNNTLKLYLFGFILSLGITAVAFGLVWGNVLSGSVLVGVLMILALVQAAVQLVFFLHLGDEKGPKWNMAVLVSTVGIIFILIFGSLWIMSHLNYNMMPQEMEEYLMQEEGIHMTQ